MGGNIFPSTRPVRREELQDLFIDISDKLELDDLTADYLGESIYGSTGKRPISNDVDVVLDERRFSPADLVAVAERAAALWGTDSVRATQLNHGQLHLAWPLRQGAAHVDFLLGNPEWLRFSCFTESESPYKAIFRSSTLCALAKRRISYSLTMNGVSIADVRWQMETRRGMFRQWRLRTKASPHLSTVDPDYWETHLPTQPIRFARVGIIDNPDDVVRILFGDGVKVEDVLSFEQVWRLICRDKTFDHAVMKADIIASMKNQLSSLYTREELVSLPIWADVSLDDVIDGRRGRVSA